MNDGELDQLLKSAAVPDRPTDYWENFPGRIVLSLTQPSRSQAVGASSRLRKAVVGWYWFAGGMATACLILAFVLTESRQQGGADFTAADLATMRKYLQEVEALFPNQVQAVIFEQGSPRLVLADRASVATKLPVYVRVCGANGCQSFLTFSGQQIRLNGEAIDVLVDARGNVLLVGTKLSWTSGGRNPRAGSLSIVARSLESAS